MKKKTAITNIVHSTTTAPHGHTHIRDKPLFLEVEKGWEFFWCDI